MKPTKKQRHEAYKYAHNVISNLKENEEEFICLLLGRFFKHEINSLHIANYLPEFNLFKPRFGAVAWFDIEYGYDGNYKSKWIKEAQKTILEFCIEMTKP